MQMLESSSLQVIPSKSYSGIRKIDAAVSCCGEDIKVCKQSESANLPRLFPL